jgi:AmmeMemoRadiSam system protein A
MAQAAAFRDPRFTPVTPDELDYLEIELSVLTPFRQVQDPEHIVVGRDGLLVTRGSHSGLLLPQVASERDWDRLTFLQETCRKAGLSPDAWQDEQTTIYAFSADVF